MVATCLKLFVLITKILPELLIAIKPSESLMDIDCATSPKGKPLAFWKTSFCRVFESVLKKDNDAFRKVNFPSLQMITLYCGI